MQKKMKTIITISAILIIIINFIGERGELVEELNIPSAIGYDLRKEFGDTVIYNVSVRTYFAESKLQNDSQVLEGEGLSIIETRDDRQLKANKKFILGLEKVIVVSEEYAMYGMKNVIDSLLNNPQVNDNGKVVVCSGMAKDILEYETKRYGGTDEVIGDMIDHAGDYNFFPEDYTLIDYIIVSSSEGRNPILPYVEITNKGIEVTGLAIFDKDKMVGKMNMEDGRILNLLRENGGKGTLVMQKNSKEYINYYPKAKRRVKCTKEEDRYKFIIELDLQGAIVSNELYKDFDSDPKVLKEFEEEMEKQVEKKCMNFINKAKDNYPVDVLDLGKVAAAKYGRGKDIDWNREVLNSIIEVKVKVKVDSQGRGDY
ncbi:Ger(x)C family spore germination protein [Clostridium malenominatum]|uniref:Ger(x)C family spore germination protein n=1 Tax=Clostridium malenominatum TaxID=1539 RepID=UPI0031D83C92